MSNPNPMHSRCGLEDCDCGYVIEKLVKALRLGLRSHPAHICGAGGMPPSECPGCVFIVEGIEAVSKAEQER